MKYIVFSFDDARADTFEIAKPILQKFGYTGTVNVISDFVLNPSKYKSGSLSTAMTIKQVLEWQQWGGEVACHGSTHQNSVEDIYKNIDELQSMGVDVSRIGFASPTSWLTLANLKSTGIQKLIIENTLFYLRSGIQVRREGLAYCFLSLVERFTHGKRLYYILNKQNIIHKSKKYEIYPSAAIKDYTTLEQIEYLINTIKDEDALIIMFHSILTKGNPLYGADHYYWDAYKFYRLCEWLSKHDDIKVLNTIELVDQWAEGI